MSALPSSPPPHRGTSTALENLQPGGLLHYDYRPQHGQSRTLPDTLRIVQWNIERGAKLTGIIQTLQACNADILVLQELDIGCRRSNYANVAREIAAALQAELYFVCEFEELDDVMRPVKHAVGPASEPRGSEEQAHHPKADATALPARHFHGNAILSRRATLADPTVIPHTAGIDWETCGPHHKEPRHGFRSVLRVTIPPQQRTSSELPPLYVYCCHFEVFCGALTRVRQLGDCIADVQKILMRASEEAEEKTSSKVMPAFVIAGDLNTMAHNIVRLSPKYATDRMRVLSLGETEACWLQRKILSRGMGPVTQGCCPFSFRFPAYIFSTLYAAVFNSSLWWSAMGGLSAEALARVDNRLCCLYDPMDKYTSITLDEPTYHGFVRGKLDWVLLSNCTVAPIDSAHGGPAPVNLQALTAHRSVTCDDTIAAIQQSLDDPDDSSRRCSAPHDGVILFNDTYKDSDHKGLLLTVRQHVGVPQEVYPSHGSVYTHSVYAMGCYVVSRLLPLALVGGALYLRWGCGNSDGLSTPQRDTVMG